MKFNEDTLKKMEQRVRARFINSLSGLKSVNLIGTTDGEGSHNLAVVSSVFHLGANPPLMGFIIRPSSAERHTLENILKTRHFTINSVDKPIYIEAHQTSARYPREVSEFDAVGLSPIVSEGFDAPFVKESPIKIGLELREHQTLAVNNTEMIIGEIKMIELPADSVMADGYVDIESLEVVCVSGLDSYHTTHRLSRLSYAKPDIDVRRLTPQGENSTNDSNSEQ